MGKFYDLIKGASHHAWDGLAVRKLAKAMDEVWYVDDFSDGDHSFDNLKEETGYTIDEVIKNIINGVPVCYDKYKLPITMLNNDLVNGNTLHAIYGYMNSDNGAIIHISINTDDKELSFLFEEV